MPDFSAALTIIPDEYVPEQPHTPESWIASSIKLADGQVEWFVSHEAAIAYMPAGTNVNAARIDPREYSLPRESISLESSSTASPSAEFTYIDVDGAFSDLIASKYANGIGLKDKIHRTYTWPVGTQFDIDLHTRSVHFIADRKTPDSAKTLTCVDIKRFAREKILKPKEWRLVSSIDATQTTDIVIYGDEPPLFEHSSDYKVDPGKRIGYLYTDKKEVIGYTGYTPVSGEDGQWELTGVSRERRADFVSVAISVDSTDKVENRPKLEEWTYLEEKTPDFFRAIYCGVTYDGRVLPDHWHAGVATRWINDYSISVAAPEFNHVKWRAENYGEVAVKDLAEKEILPFLPGAFVVNRFGQLQLYRITSVDGDGGEDFTFDISNVDGSSVGALITKNSQTVKAISLEYGYDARTEVFATRKTFLNAAAQNVGNQVHTLKSKLLHSSLHTEAQIDNFVSVIGDIKFDEIVEITFTALPSTKAVRLGERVRVNLNVPGGSFRRDDSNNASAALQLDRSMVVMSRAQTSEGGWTYTCYGTRQRASQAIRSTLARHASIDAYRINGSDLRDDANVVDNGDGTWTLLSSQLSLNKKYYFLDGPLIFPDGQTITATDTGPMLQLWCYISATLNGRIDLKGRGKNAGGAPGQLGDAGYGLRVRSAGGVVSRSRFRENNSRSDVRADQGADYDSPAPVQYPAFSSGDAPGAALANNDGLVTGLPTDLSGYGGPGSPGVSIEYVQPNQNITQKRVASYSGKSGGRSGAGFMLVTPVREYGDNFVLDLSGADGQVAEQIVAPGTSAASVYIAAGGPGGPGNFLDVYDSGNQWGDPSRYALCYPGLSVTPGTRLGKASNAFSRKSPVRSYYEASRYANYSAQLTRTISIPAPENIQQRLTGLSGDLGSDGDGGFSLIVTATDTDPSNANDNDLRVWQQHVDSGELEPPMRQFNASAGQWFDFDWNGQHRDAGRVLLDGKRFRDSTRLWNGRPSLPPGKIGDSYLDTNTGLIMHLSSSLATDEPLTGLHDLGESILPDSFFEKYINGDNTWVVSRSRFEAPRLSDGSIGKGGSVETVTPVYSLTVTPDPTSGGVIAGVAGSGYIGRGVFVDFASKGGANDKIGFVQADGTFTIPYDPANDGAIGNTLSAFVNLEDGTQEANDPFIYQVTTQVAPTLTITSVTGDYES